jgi:hypothetical protein
MSSSFDSQFSTTSKFRETVLPIFISLMGTLIALFPANPGNVTLPSRDSGVFLYAGWRFLNGEIPIGMCGTTNLH